MRTISALPCYFHKPSAYWKIANCKVTIDKSAFGFINVFFASLVGFEPKERRAGARKAATDGGAGD